MYTILMLNQKGGVGKTTIADELSFALERRGKTVAFVTTDPQGGSVHEVPRGESHPRTHASEHARHGADAENARYRT